MCCIFDVTGQFANVKIIVQINIFLGTLKSPSLVRLTKPEFKIGFFCN